MLRALSLALANLLSLSFHSLKPPSSAAITQEHQHRMQARR
jgi:hypothetical protein